MQCCTEHQWSPALRDRKVAVLRGTVQTRQRGICTQSLADPLLSIPLPMQLSGQGGSQALVASGHLQGLRTWALSCSHTFHTNQTTTGRTKPAFGKTVGETSQQGIPSFSMAYITRQLSFHLCPSFKIWAVFIGQGLSCHKRSCCQSLSRPAPG